MTTQIDPRTLTATQRKTLNQIARKAGHGTCTSLVLDPTATEISIKHSPYGVSTPSGKFFAGQTHTYNAKESYCRAETVITLSPATLGA